MSGFFISNSYVKRRAAFGAIALMIARDQRQTDLRATVRTFAVNVGFTVFPFVSAQEKPLLAFARIMQILSVFRRALVYVSGKHTVKHKRADEQGKSVQQNTDQIILGEYRQHGDHEINDE